jgi:hypothetical protein
LLEAEIDTSGSLESLDAAWSAIQPTLGVVASTYRCGTVIVSRFDCDGWVAKPLVKLELPAVQHAELPPLVGEWTGMTNVQEARREQRRILQAEADHRYADALRGALAPLDKIVLPAGDSAGSDIAGALHRYSQYRGARLRIVILLSDLGDTHCGTLPPVPAPTGNIRVLALVMPMKRKDANYLHEPLTGADQYETRCKWLRGGAPWVAVAPFFSNDAVELLGSIESGRHDR